MDVWVYVERKEEDQCNFCDLRMPPPPKKNAQWINRATNHDRNPVVVILVRLNVLGLDLDLSRSCSVIGHVNIRLVLLYCAVLCTRSIDTDLLS